MLKKIGKIYQIISVIAFTVFLTAYVISFLFDITGCSVKEVEATRTVLGHISRPTVQGMDYYLIVGEIMAEENYPNGVPVIMTKVSVNNLDKYPIGSRVNFRCFKNRIMGGYRTGHIADDPEELTSIWGGKENKRPESISKPTVNGWAEMDYNIKAKE